METTTSHDSSSLHRGYRAVTFTYTTHKARRFTYTTHKARRYPTPGLVSTIKTNIPHFAPFRLYICCLGSPKNFVHFCIESKIVVPMHISSFSRLISPVIKRVFDDRMTTSWMNLAARSEKAKCDQIDNVLRRSLRKLWQEWPRPDASVHPSSFSQRFYHVSSHTEFTGHCSSVSIFHESRTEFESFFCLERDLSFRRLEHLSLLSSHLFIFH